jgi:hypothetical protein
MLRAIGRVWFFTAVLPALVAAEPPSTPEFRVNVTTAGRQQAPAVDADAAGNFVLAWKDGNEGVGVRARRFSALGIPLGGEIPVHTSSSFGNYPAFPPGIATDRDGDFVVVWQDGGIFAQRYAANGATVGGRIEVYPGPFVQAVDVASDAEGNFVVVWDGEGEIFVRLYDAGGHAIGDAFPVSSSPYQRLRPAVDRAGDGRFVVVWQSVEQDSPCPAPDGDCFGEEYGVYARVFDADGRALTDELLANTQVLGNQEAGKVALGPDGDFVVAWESFTDRWNAYAQRFDASGTRVGGELVLNSLANAHSPVVATDDRGGFVVAKTVFGGPGLDLDVMARRFDADATPLEPEFLVNTVTSARQSAPVIAATPAGFVVAWSSFGQDGSEEEIFARVYGVGVGAIAPIDFGGNGDTDLAVFRPSDGRWLADFDALPGAELDVVYGRGGDVPVPADYDGDGVTDFAVFRPESGTWFVDTDRNGGTDLRIVYGRSGDVPVPADYDGDGVTDFAVFRPESGTWFIDTDRNGGTDLRIVYGRSGDVPVPADYDGDGVTDFAVFRPESGTWFVDTDRNGGTNLRVPYGRAGDLPLPGDYDGDGIADFAVFRPPSATWFVDTNRNGGTDLQRIYGAAGDVPVPGDYDGDGRRDFAVYRPSSSRWFVDVDRNGGTDFFLTFGDPGDVPLRENGWILDALGLTAPRER